MLFRSVQLGRRSDGAVPSTGRPVCGIHCLWRRGEPDTEAETAIIQFNELCGAPKRKTLPDDLRHRPYDGELCQGADTGWDVFGIAGVDPVGVLSL